MKKSLYLKFILGYIFFALLSFFTIATISARLTYHHCLEQQAGLLRADAVRMADECSSLYTGGSETPETLYPELTRISSFLDARLWIIDMNGTIAYDSEDELKDTTVEEFDPAWKVAFTTASFSRASSSPISGKFVPHFTQN